MVVIEARERLGGRLHSSASQPPLDLGATWFWPGERRVTRLVAELGVATFDQYLGGDAVLHTDQDRQVVAGNPIDVPSYRFVNGASSLVEAVTATMPADVTRLGEPVTRVAIDASSNDGLVTVSTKRSTYTARHVVIALPPSLAQHAIAFEPPLPDQLDRLAAITPVWMGATTKVVASYATPFWRQAGLAGAAISYVGPLHEVHDMSGPHGNPAALFGFAPGVAGETAPGRGAVLRQLVAMFGSAAGKPIALDIHDWRAEPFTSPPDVERRAAYQLFGHPLFQQSAVGGRLHWASTETATESPGHIEGALQAAERTVNTLISTLDTEGSTIA